MPERSPPPLIGVAAPGTRTSSGVSKPNQNTPVTEHHRTHDTAAHDAINLILEHGLDGLSEAFTVLLNQAMIAERTRHLNAAPHERSEGRDGHANGFKPKSLHTRAGTLALDIPQVRGSSTPFYPSSLERGQRSEQALKIAVAEMYLQGVSTRRVGKVMAELCGFEPISSEVSRPTASLDPMLNAWRGRPIDGAYSLLLCDATYEKVRVGGQVVSCALLVAIGIRKDDGRRVILGCSVSLSEAEVHWRGFFQSLKARGLGLPRMITSDAHQGLGAALQACFPGVPWQRCQFILRFAPALLVRRRMGKGQSPPAERTGPRTQGRYENRCRRYPAPHLQRRRPRRG